MLSILSGSCALIAFLSFRQIWFGSGFALLGLFQAIVAVYAFSRNKRCVVQLKGFKWDINDFCRGWIITGMTGSGKTTAAINHLLWQVSKHCANWGGVCIDEKGLFWETLTTLFEKVGRKNDLILLKVRPDNANATWQPEHRFNFLDIPGIPFSAHAKAICDVAASLGQKSDKGFFKTQAQIHIEWALKALAESGRSANLSDCYHFLTNERTMHTLLAVLEKKDGVEALSIIDHFNDNFLNQPPE